MSKEMEILLKAWLDHKYFESGCVDASLEWCNRQHNLVFTLEEMEEFIKWRDSMKKIREEICKNLTYHKFKDLEKILVSL